MKAEETEEFEKGLMDAVGEGIALAATAIPAKQGAEPAKEPESESTETEQEGLPVVEATDSESDSPEEEKTDSEPHDIAAGGETQLPDSVEGEEDSTPKSVDSSEAEPLAASTSEEKKTSDEFDDLPEDAPQKTRERFDSMKDKYDEQAAELVTSQDQNTQWMNAINETGANPEQYGQALSYLSAINAGTTEGLEAAYSFMEKEMAVLAKQLGKTAPGYNPLDDFPDLKKEVDDGFLDEARAMELASSRAKDSFQSATTDANRANGDYEAAQQQAISGLSQLRTKLIGENSGYEKKIPILNPVVESIIQSGAHPSTWVTAIESAYRGIPDIPTAVQPKPKAPDSLTQSAASGEKGSFEKMPGSIEEAIDAVLP